MAIRVECEECGKKYKLSDNRAGEWIECRECGFDIEVPDDGWDDESRDRERLRYENEEEVNISVKLLSGAKELWGGPQSKFSNQVGLFARFTLKEGETLQQVLSRSMWNSVDSTLTSVAFPQRIFDPSMSNSFGTSMFVNGQPSLCPRQVADR